MTAPEAWNATLGGGLANRLAGWWTVFDDPVMTALMEEAAGGNLDLREAAAS